MSFERRVYERTEIRRKESETLSATIMGHDVILHTHEGCSRLSILRYRNSPLHLGIIELHPNSVAELEEFAKISGELLLAVASELRAAGKDDLRSESKKLMDEFEIKMDLEIKSAIQAVRDAKAEGGDPETGAVTETKPLAEAS